MKCILRILIIALSLYAISTQNSLQGTAINGKGWVGLEFSKGVKVSQISWTQQSEGDILGVFEGANDKSFVDAIPLYVITSDSSKQAKVQVTQSFKYVRYVTPKGKTSSISSFQVQGTEGESTGEPTNLYTPTKIPLVVVHTTSGADPVDKENQLEANIIIIKDGAVNVKGKGTIKLRGNSTLNQDKKPYRIKFDEKVNPLGFKATAKKWVLFANAYDKSLMRNLVAYKMSDLLGLKWAPQCQHVDMIINGDFIGNYLFCDQIDVNKDRVNIQKMEKTDTTEPAVTGGYIVEIDFYAEKEPAYFKTTGGVLVSIKYPGADTTPEQKSYIEKKISAVETELNNGKFDNIDIDNFLQYFVLQDFTGSPDSLFSSVYISKDRGNEKINIGPIWDVDLAFGNMKMSFGGAGGATTEKNFGFKSGMSSGGVANTVTKILGNNVVLPKLKDFWKKVTSSSLTTDALFDFIDKVGQTINDSQKLNFIKWNVLNEKAWYNPVSLGSWEAEVNALKQFIETRMTEFTEIVNAATVESITKQTSQGGWGGWGGQGGQGGQWGGQGGQGGGFGGQGGQWGGFGGN